MMAVVHLDELNKYDLFGSVSWFMQFYDPVLRPVPERASKPATLSPQHQVPVDLKIEMGSEDGMEVDILSPKPVTPETTYRKPQPDLGSEHRGVESRCYVVR